MYKRRTVVHRESGDDMVNVNMNISFVKAHCDNIAFKVHVSRQILQTVSLLIEYAGQYILGGHVCFVQRFMMIIMILYYFGVPKNTTRGFMTCIVYKVAMLLFTLSRDHMTLVLL